MSDTESDLDVDDELTETTSKFKTPNANKAGQANTETGLTNFYACVTMIDVKEGDCYVVDLLHGAIANAASSWNRFLIDTGKPHDTDDRLAKICGAFYGGDQTEKGSIVVLKGPWESSMDKTRRPEIPRLSGIIVTHSDADHCGFAKDVMIKLGELPGNEVPANNDARGVLPVWVSPMKDWTDDIIIRCGRQYDKLWGFGFEFFQVQATIHWHKSEYKGVSLAVTRRTVSEDVTISLDKTWRNIWDLAKQAKYTIVCRFSRLPKSIKNISKTLKSEVFSPVSQERIKQALGNVPFVQEKFKSELFHEYEGPLENGETIIVELGLVPEVGGRQPIRTLSDKPIKELITGRWLRAAFDVRLINKEKNKRNPKDESATQSFKIFSSLEKSKSLPAGLKTECHVVGLDDAVRDLGLAPSHRAGIHYSNSRLGCTGSEFTRDFVHMILQYRLPDRKNQVVPPNDDFTPSKLITGKPKNVCRSVLEGLDHFRPKKPRLWGEYANRASILTHFVYSKALSPTYLNPKRRPGTGDFNMLFTGDAFEAGRGETAYTNERKFGYHSLEQSSEVRPDGNILSWLWQQRLMPALRVDVLKVPHHGSSVTTNSSFYRNVSASVYLISGAANPHGHPRAETMASIISTILLEDGGALAPNCYRQDDEKDPEKLKKPHINERPRPRLIFLTNQTNYSLNQRWARARKKARDEYMNAYILKKIQANLESDKYKKMTAHFKRKAKSDWTAQAKQGLENAIESTLEDHATLRKDFFDTVAKRTKELMQGDQQNPDFSSGFRNEVFATDWMRELCNNLRPQYKVPLANVRIFYQKTRGAATRLRFGRDWYRPEEVRCEWHEDDWVETRYEWDAEDYERAHPRRAIPPLAEAYAEIKNDPLAYPYPGRDQWEYPGGEKQKPGPDRAYKVIRRSGAVSQSHPAPVNKPGPNGSNHLDAGEGSIDSDDEALQEILARAEEEARLAASKPGPNMFSQGSRLEALLSRSSNWQGGNIPPHPDEKKGVRGLFGDNKGGFSFQNNVVNNSANTSNFLRDANPNPGGLFKWSTEKK